MMKLSAGLLAALPAFAILGCGESEDRLERVPVSGTLLVDGKPHGRVLLQLTPNPPDPARPVVNGYVKEDGSFTLQTYEEGDGAPPGQYEARLTMDPMAPGNVPAAKPKLVEIPSDQEEVTLELNLESSGQMVSPLPRPGQEGGKKSGGRLIP